MCGIAGLVAWDERYRAGRDLLGKMSSAIRHRGPDAQAVWIGEDPGNGPRCSLVFARLAILDPDPRAMQPMGDGRRWIVFNGEIYNFRELRKELESRDPSRAWRTSGDTEVLLAAYDAWGADCLGRLNGMYAFAVWDPAKRELFLARDRMGQKPLYVAQAPEGGAIAFASELAALRPLSWPDWQIDPAALTHYLRTGYIPSPWTIYRGVRKLGPASWMRCSGQACEQGTYFDANRPAPGPVDAAAIKRAVLSAVSRQLVADVPLGCFLSGGTDSSVIAAAMKSAVGDQGRVLSFSIGFDDPRYDETRYAAEVAAHLGTEHRSFVVQPDAAEDLPKLAAVYGEPFGDSSALPTHYLSMQTRRHVTVALSGDGGDELFGGYDRYRAMKLARSAQRVPSALRSAASALPGTHPKSTAARLKRFIGALDLPPAQRYAAYTALFDAATLAKLYPAATQDDLVAQTFSRLGQGRDDVQAALATDRVTYLPDDLLAKVDRASMLHALEVRAPFMDHELVSLAAGLQTDQLLSGGPKRMLREAFAADLPRSVFTRRKMGFALPIGDWLRDPLAPMLRDLLGATNSFASAHLDRTQVDSLIADHGQRRADHSQRLYALLMLELWHRGSLRG